MYRLGKRKCSSDVLCFSIQDQTEGSLGLEDSLLYSSTDLLPPSLTSTKSHLDPTTTPKFSSRGKRKASPPECRKELTPYQAEILNKLDQAQTKYTENEHYLLSLAPTLDRLDPRKQAMVRLRFQQALFDIEFGE